MRIALVTSGFPRFPGDFPGNFIFDLARSMVQQGVEAHVLAPHDTGCPEGEEREGVVIHRFRYVPHGVRPALCYGSGIPDNLKRSLAAWCQVPAYSVSLLLAISRLVRQAKIDVINSHWLLMQGLAAAVLRNRLGIPHLCTVHAGELSLLPRMPFGRQVAAFTVRHSDRLICVSTRTRRRLEELLQAPVDATVMPMGIRADAFQNKSLTRETARKAVGVRAEKALLFVGRLAEKKGVGYLIQALPGLRSLWAGLELWIIGTGHEENRLRAQAQEFGVNEAVRFAGRVANKDLPTYYRAADVLVLPSIISATGDEEGMPVVLLEALAAGCPVVATRTGGTPELIRDGENGFLVEPADPDSLADGIRRALSASDVARIRQAAYETAEKFDWPKVAAAYREMAEDLLRRTRPRRRT